MFAGASVLFERVDQAPPALFGLTLHYTFFLIGIVVLWCLVGWILDKRLWRNERDLPWTTAKLLLIGAPIALMGSLFLYTSLQGFMGPRGRWNNPIGNFLDSLLFLMWSLVLLGVPVVKLARRLTTRVTDS